MKTMICVSNLGYSQSNYELFRSINRVTEKSLEEVSVVPVDITNKVIELNTAVMNIGELTSFNDGVLVATTIENAQRILSCFTNTIKVLYLYDLDWMFQTIVYDELYDTLTHPDLTIFVRSESHIQPLKALCGIEPHGILESFTLEKLWNLLEDIKKQS
jgi:hypothetical protein